MMWIGVQIAIFCFLVGMAMFLPEKIYTGIVILLFGFSFFAVFVNWLLIIQVCNIAMSSTIGYGIISARNSLSRSVGGMLILIYLATGATIMFAFDIAF